MIALHMIGDRRGAAIAAREHPRVAGVGLEEDLSRAAERLGVNGLGRPRGLFRVRVEERRGAQVRGGGELHRATGGLQVVDGTHTVIRSRMKGAAAARLGNDQTPGRARSSSPRLMADAPIASARPRSSGRSPTTHEAARSRPSAAAAAFAMPGLGLRSSLVRANASTIPAGW